MIKSASKAIAGLLSLSIATQYPSLVKAIPRDPLNSTSGSPFLGVAIPPRGVFEGDPGPATPPVIADVYVPLIAASRILAAEQQFIPNEQRDPTGPNASNKPFYAKDPSADFVLATWINKNAPVNAAFFKRVFECVPVVFFRDSGSIPTTRDFLKGHIFELKAAGVTDLAVALPPDMEEDIIHFLKTNDPDSFLTSFGGKAFEAIQSLVPLLQAAHREGIQIRCFDVGLLFHPMSLEALHSEGFKQQLAANLYDRIMAKNPLAKVAVLASAALATRSAVPERLRVSFGIKSLVFDVPYLYNRFYARDANADAILTRNDDHLPQNTVAAVPAENTTASPARKTVDRIAQRTTESPSKWDLSSGGRLTEAIVEGRAIGRRASIPQLTSLQGSYNDHFGRSLEELARLVILTDPEAIESQSHLFMKEVITVMVYAAAIVGMIEKHGHSKLNMELGDRQYWINLLGSERDPKDMESARRGLTWLVDAFDLTSRPEIVERINAPIKFMGYAAYAELAMELAEVTLKLGWPENSRGRRVLSIFYDIYSTFSNGGASHHTFPVGSGSVRRIFISNGNTEADSAGTIVHEMTHEILDQLEPSFADDQPEEVTKMTDWFTSAFEMITVYRDGGMDEKLTQSKEGLLSSTFYIALTFERQIQKFHALSTAERVAQMDQSVQDSLNDMLEHPAWNQYVLGKGKRIHFYLRGAAFGAEALKRARELAAAEGRPDDQTYIYTLAGKYVAAGAMGGAHQTFAEVVARSDEALQRHFQSPTQPGLNVAREFGRSSLSVDSIASQWIQENKADWMPGEMRPKEGEQFPAEVPPARGGLSRRSLLSFAAAGAGLAAAGALSGQDANAMALAQARQALKAIRPRLATLGYSAADASDMTETLDNLLSGRNGWSIETRGGTGTLASMDLANRKLIIYPAEFLQLDAAGQQAGAGIHELFHSTRKQTARDARYKVLGRQIQAAMAAMHFTESVQRLPEPLMALLKEWLTLYVGNEVDAYKAELREKQRFARSKGFPDFRSYIKKFPDPTLGGDARLRRHLTQDARGREAVNVTTLRTEMMTWMMQHQQGVVYVVIAMARTDQVDPTSTPAMATWINGWMDEFEDKESVRKLAGAPVRPELEPETGRWPLGALVVNVLRRSMKPARPAPHALGESS